MASQLDRMERMLMALCDHLGLDRENTSSSETLTEVGAEAGRRYVGTVSHFEHGWGFIECAGLRRNVFVYHRDIEGTGLPSLEAGEEVSFEVGPGKGGRPKAFRVRRQQTDQVSGPVRRRDAGDGASQDDGSRTETQGEEDEGESLPEPASSAVPRQRSSFRQVPASRARRGASPQKRPAISW